MGRGVKLDIDFADLGEGWCADNRAKPDAQAPVILPPEKHRLRLFKQKRRGKWVCVAEGFALEAQAAKALLKSAKKALGRGGTFKEDRLELQGEDLEALGAWLEGKGFGLK